MIRCYDGEYDDDTVSNRKWRDHIAWLSAGPGSYWYDSADPWDEEEELEDEDDESDSSNNEVNHD